MTSGDIYLQTSEVAPDVLKEHGKTKNPYPNVDAASGCVLYHYGLTEFKVRYNINFVFAHAYQCSVLYCHFWSFQG